MKVLKKIIIILFLISMLFPKTTNAMSQARAGDTLSQFAINFERDYAEQTKYSTDGWKNYDSGDRAMAYKGIKQCKGTNGYYGMDCVGWVGCAIHWSLKLGNNNRFTSFVVPSGEGGQTFHAEDGFAQIDKNSVLQAGDILCFWNHVGIYAIDPTTKEKLVIHCDGHGKNGAGVCRSNFDDYVKGKPIYYVARITNEAAGALNENNVTTMFNEVTGAADDYGLYYGTTQGRYTGSYNIGDWLFDKIAGFFDYLVGILTYVIRIPILGWTNIVEFMVNNFIDEISGANEVQEQQQEEQEFIGPPTEEQIAEEKEKEQEQEKLYKPAATDKWERVNIEDIIYNHVPILDVNFFSFDEAAGEELQEGSVIYTIRANVAKWYMIIRKVSIIMLLLILIYLGIQTAINTAAGKRGKYKGMLVAWVTSFLVIFCIHYFMMIVIDINQFLVETFENANSKAVEEKGYSKDGAVSIYDTIRTRAYSLKLSEGVPATIMYMVLVYYLIKFLYIYFKRYLTVNILAILGPIIAIKYAFDKIKSGKGGSLTNWMFDFFINVFLQSIHAILYTIFMIMAFDLAVKSIAGFAIALVILNFMLKAEKIFINIFKFESRGSSLSDVREDKNYLVEAYKTGMLVGGFAKGTARFMFGGVRAVGNLGFGIVQDGINAKGRFSNYLNNWKRKEHGEEPLDYEPIVVKDKIKDTLKNVGYKVGDGINNKVFKGKNLRLGMHNMKDRDPKLYKTTEKAIKATRNMTKKNWTRTIKKGTKTISSMAKVMVGIPMSIADTKEGSMLLYSGISDLKGIMKGKTHYGHRSKSNIWSRRGKVAATIATGGTFALADGIAGEIRQVNKDAKKMKKHKEKLRYLANINSLEDDIEKELNLINIQKDMEKKGKTDKEKEDIEKKYNREISKDIHNAANSVLAGSTISSVVKDYMYENNISEMTEKDVQNVMKQLENMTETDELKLKFGSKIKANVKDEMKKELGKKKKSLDAKKTVNVIEDAIMREGSVEIEKPKYEVLSQKIRELKTVSEKAKNSTGSYVSSTGMFIKNVTKENEKSSTTQEGKRNKK